VKPSDTLLLTRQEVAKQLSVEECIDGVEQAFKLYGEGKTAPPGILGMHAKDGGFHLKAAMLTLNRNYFAVKMNGNFFQNMKRFGMPNIQGIIMLCDGENGYPLALMDSIDITIKRTGAATAVAAKYLARPESKILTICGCGNQGRISARAIHKVRPLERVFAFDVDKSRAQLFAKELSDELKIEANAVDDLTEAVRASEICVTCTPSRKFYLHKTDVSPGTFIAAVGADSEDKQELEPALLASSNVVVDILDQCATIGELHHALKEGAMNRDDVHAELGEIIAGRKPGRVSPEEIIIFDSTGTALQDVAAAATVYEKAISSGAGVKLNFFA
jgi:ornithine cyclodeaminase/alanine dehydrogenase